MTTMTMALVNGTVCVGLDGPVDGKWVLEKALA
jgi:hypothetical protein